MMRLTHKIISTTFFCMLWVTCLAQNLSTNIKFYNYEDGLPDRVVHSINQDDRGVIWIGTGNGLCRFDGKKFNTFNGKNSPLGSGRIVGIIKDQFGNLWIQKNGEPVIHFNPLNETELPLTEEIEKYGELTVSHFRNSSVGKVFFSNEENATFKLNDSNEIVPFGALTALENRVDVPTLWGTIFRGSTSIGPFVEVDQQGDTIRDFSSIGRGRVFIENTEVIFWRLPKEPTAKFTTDAVFIKENGDTPKIDFKKDGESYLFNMRSTSKIYSLQDNKKNSWVSIDGRIILFDENRNFQKDLTEKLEETSGKIGGVNAFFVDNHNRLWIGSGMGLFIVELKQNPFQKYINKEGMSTRGITELSDDRILISSYKGTKILDKNSGELVDSIARYGMTLTEYNKEFVLFSYGTELMVYNQFNQSLKAIDYRFTDSGRKRTSVIYYDQEEEELYVGHDKGTFNSEDSILVLPHKNLKEFKDFPRREITFFYKNKEGIWIATLNGLYLLDKEKGLVDHVVFPHNHIKHFHEDKEGDFWLATGGGGLIHWDRESNTKRQFTTEDGLSHNVLYAVYEDQSGLFWLPSNKGLMRFDKQTGEVNVFLPEDGICHEEFNTHSHYQGADGRLYFGGLEGVTAFNPEEVALAKNEAPFILTQYQQFDASESVLLNKTAELLSSETINLYSKDKFFILDFALLDYSQNDIVYAWKIDGLDEEWNFQKENTIRINALNYGSYTLRLKARGSGGQWAENKIAIPIKVHKPFYIKPLFLALLIIGVLALIYTYFRYRLKNVERSRAKLKALVGERTSELSEKNRDLEEANRFKDKILSVIAHDLRAPLLTLNDLSSKINYLIQKGRVDDIARLSNSINKSSRNVHILLDNLFNWALVQKGEYDNIPQEINLKQTIDQVLQLYQSTAETKSISLVGFQDVNLKAYADPNAVATIFRNLINNAIKFTKEGGSVHVDAKQDNGFVEIKVQDTGIGIPEKEIPYLFDFYHLNERKGTGGEKGKGFGLKLCNELVVLNKGTLQVSSENREGTSFLVYLPIKITS